MLLSVHPELTGSQRAKELLAGWEGSANLQGCRRLYHTRPKASQSSWSTPDQYLARQEYDSRVTCAYGNTVAKFTGQAPDGSPLPAGKAKLHRHKYRLLCYADEQHPRQALRCYLDDQRRDSGSSASWGYYRLVEIRCEICHHTQEELVTTPSAGQAFSAELIASNLMDNFYTYYEIRCPEEDAGEPYHQFVDRKGTSLCRRCGYTGERDLIWYRKYLKAFKDSLAREAQANLLVAPAQPTQPKSRGRQVAAHPTPKSPLVIRSGKLFSELSNRLEETYSEALKMSGQQLTRAFHYLGAVERYEYDRVLSDRVRPELNEQRGPRLNSYIGQILIEYSTLLNHKELGTLPAGLAEIADKLPPVDKLPPLRSLVPGIAYNSWIVELRCQTQLNPTEIVEQQYLYLCSLLLALMKIPKLQPWIQYLINGLIENERISAKLSDSKASSVAANNQVILLSNAMETQMDAVYSTEETSKSANTADAEDPGFSYDAMDYDGHNDGEKD
jgi:hypothetical protein